MTEPATCEPTTCEWCNHPTTPVENQVAVRCPYCQAITATEHWLPLTNRDAAHLAHTLETRITAALRDQLHGNQ